RDGRWIARRVARATRRQRVGTRDPFARRPRVTEAAERRSGVLEGEPSAMLPAVSAALAEWPPGRTLDASERSMQTRLGAINAAVCKADSRAVRRLGGLSQREQVDEHARAFVVALLRCDRRA